MSSSYPPGTTWTVQPRPSGPGNYVGTYTLSSSAICPDLLRYEMIGEADGLRGRVVRAFFWLLRAWPV